MFVTLGANAYIRINVFFLSCSKYIFFNYCHIIYTLYCLVWVAIFTDKNFVLLYFIVISVSNLELLYWVRPVCNLNALNK